MVSSLKNAQPPPSVAVLLAAYNGLEWINEQIDTILSQKNIDINIFVSVDVSSDGTYEWCRDLAKRNSCIEVLPYGDHFGGAANNFYRLIYDVDFNKYNYIALADQDDIWLPDKLSHSVNILQKNDLDAYSSDVMAFWSDGRKKLVKKSYPQKRYDYIFEAAGPGCSYVFKRQSLQKFKNFLIKNWGKVSVVESHDWLIYAFFRSRNMSWYIDNKAVMLYRQHEANQVGINFGFFAYLKRVKMIKNGWYYSEVQKISKAIGKTNGCAFNLERWFLIKNVYQLRRQNRDVFILMLMIIFGFFK